jgi:hypothetical protein
VETPALAIRYRSDRPAQFSTVCGGHTLSSLPLNSSYETDKSLWPRGRARHRVRTFVGSPMRMTPERAPLPVLGIYNRLCLSLLFSVHPLVVAPPLEATGPAAAQHRRTVATFKKCTDKGHKALYLVAHSCL